MYNRVSVSYTHLGEAIEKVIRLDLTYDEIENSIDNIWSVLFTTGYLTKLLDVYKRQIYRSDARSRTHAKHM